MLSNECFEPKTCYCDAYKLIQIHLKHRLGMYMDLELNTDQLLKREPILVIYTLKSLNLHITNIAHCYCIFF